MRQILKYSFYAILILAGFMFVGNKGCDSKPVAESLNAKAATTEPSVFPREKEPNIWERMVDYDNQLSNLSQQSIHSVEDAKSRIASCKEAASHVEFALRVQDDTLQRKAMLVRGKLKKYQERYYPKFRQAYANQAKDKLWEHDVEVDVSGKRNEKITFTAGVFAANKNIKAAFEAIQADLETFRFKEARFRWYKGQGDYTYYSLKSKSDPEF